MKRVPITILTGFLGAGKSTTLNSILEQRGDKKLAVIVNEFGDVGIDHQLLIPIDESIYEINEGCICCTVREDLVNVLYNINQAILEEKIEVDAVVVETTGIADVAPILQTLTQIPVMENYFEIDSVITLVDGVNAIYQIENYEEAQNQIAFADKIFITKADLISEKQLEEVQQTIRSIQKFAPIEVMKRGEITYKDVVGARLYNKTDLVVEEKHYHDEDCSCGHHHHGHDEDCNCGHHHHHGDDEHVCDEHCDHDHYHDENCDCGHHHHHEHTVSSFALEADKCMNIERFDYWLNWLLDLCNYDLLRYKGILCFENTEDQMVLQGVLTNATIDTNYKKIPTPPKSTIVLIGKHLPRKQIEEAFETMVLKEV